jgi:tellurite resistance protein TerC
LEGLLSIDNAAVLGALVSVLPNHQPVPYPRPLRFLQEHTDQLLGMQQAAALKVGLLMAYLGRGLMLILAAWVSSHPLLKIAGAVYLLKLALGHFAQRNEPAQAAEITGPSAQASNNMAVFWWVVLQVELTDLVFSLDNVVVAVALSRQLWVVLLGVALGIIIMRFAAGLFTWLIQREPILITAAYLIVFNIGLELLLVELFQIEFNQWYKFAVSMGTLLLCVAYARWQPLQILAPSLQGIKKALGGLNHYLNGVLAWISFPLKLIVEYLLD